MKEKKYLWGLLTGLIYAAVLLVISFWNFRAEGVNITGYITTILVCAGSAMLGGMIS